MQIHNITNVDLKILSVLAQNSELSLRELCLKTGILSPSAISRRIQKMKDNGIIKGKTLEVDLPALGYKFITATFVKAKYGPGYSDMVASKIAKIKGVTSILFLLGDIDFVLTTVCRSKEEYSRILDELTKIQEIERTDSRTVLKSYMENNLSFLELSTQ
ncbi:MAG: Lrp/AsnC family transcriptional regulator [Candidatus Thermoplasmatota archaeon]|nr:Lrp/AsnC family transcriptional regulator [Candidatus Thermoplasmatota archaeon]MCL5889111.1 Lrp/AsnC family transcriptional regulator [Candidatus Thermoplasmatota archaeon]